MSSLSSFRCLSDGTRSDTTGTYANTTPVFSYSTVGGNNSLSVKKLEYKLHSGSSWTTAVSSVTSGTAYTFGGSLEIANSYDIRCTVTDAVGNSGVLTFLLPPVVGIAFGLKNDRARFGGPVEKAGLQIDWPTEINSTLDITPRRCYATLSSAGWYRVMSYTATSATNVTGGVAFSVDFTLFEQARQMHKITLNGLLGVFGFGNEYSVTGTANSITKIRYTYDTNNVGYVDIYFAGSSRSVGCCFSVYTRTPVIQSRFAAESLQAVADSPSGETVLTEYSFAANTDAVGTITPESGITLSEIRVVQRGKVVQIHGVAKGSFTAGTTGYTIGTVSGITMPPSYLRCVGGCGSQVYYAYNSAYILFDSIGVITARVSVNSSYITFNFTYILD